MPTDLRISLLDVPYLTLLKQRLGRQTAKLLIATVSPLFLLVLNIRLNNIPENSLEPQCLAPTRGKCGTYGMDFAFRQYFALLYSKLIGVCFIV